MPPTPRFTLYGNFEKDNDTDVFKIHFPKDEPAPTVRTTGRFEIWPSGKDHDGSAVAVGKMWLVDPTDSSILAQIDNSGAGDDGKQEVSPPMKLDKDYLLYVQRPAGKAAVPQRRQIALLRRRPASYARRSPLLFAPSESDSARVARKPPHPSQAWRRP